MHVEAHHKIQNKKMHAERDGVHFRRRLHREFLSKKIKTVPP